MKNIDTLSQVSQADCKTQKGYNPKGEIHAVYIPQLRKWRNGKFEECLIEKICFGVKRLV